MNNLKPPSGNPKSVAILVLLAGLVLISGFNATKTLLFPCKSNESSVGLNANASSVDPLVEVNSNNPGVKPVVSTDKPGFTSGNPNVTVWVNTSSRVYHCPNTRWYGNTNNGKYMTQQEAQSKGYRPAHGNMCG
jgi:hypothetical protein